MGRKVIWAMSILISLLIIFGLLFIGGGFMAVWEGIVILGYTIFSLVKMHLYIIINVPIPNSIFDLFKSVIEDEWALTHIQWVDNTLLSFASIIPSVVFFSLGTFGLSVSPKITAPLSFFIFILVLFAFQSILFWIIILLFVAGLIVILIFNKISKT